MTANLNTLTQAIQAAGPTNTVTSGAANLASAYATYAAGVQSASGDACLTIPVGQASMQAVLATATPSVNPAAGAAVIAQAFVAFWTGATFGINGIPPVGVGGDAIFSKVLTSVVIAALPEPLQTALAALPFTASAATSAANLAQLLHAATISQVTVLISGLDTTVPTPVPITNTGPLS